MANIRQLDKRRKSVKNIRKITRTMELIATARFKKAMDRAAAATDYTKRITQIVQDLAKSGTDVTHPLLNQRDEIKSIDMLVLTANRGLCGGYNGNVVKAAVARRAEIKAMAESGELSVSGKRGIAALKFAGVPIEKMYTDFEDQPAFDAVGRIADELIARYITGKVDRVDVAYTKFISSSKQIAVVETLLPFGGFDLAVQPAGKAATESNLSDPSKGSIRDDYEFLPDAGAILEEVVPASFRARLFKCFLDAAVSEQIARMVAMKSATENAGDLIKSLSRTYNRARQSKITGEIMEIIGGVEALG
ncbi:ATP synthase gamma chain [Pirellula sp. SH-Sr6A]|uniref:ATP synthase F1 subunit gamma n=1 Tax=Pirellula sp. SH-Sr6A TaxID=1632865 RepID=UPI00078E0F2A|nr:ATP synthase F1 subunit gamma [Pirellula sp. SH-Sr6A]AMV34721.1 ATP synthase gamma chain [Pirellula sp. SH-Sr6A]